MIKKEIYDLLKAQIPEDKIWLEEPMSKHTSFKIGGPAEVYITANSIKEIKNILQVGQEKNIPITIIGSGTNILVKDGGIKGIILKPDLQSIKIEDENITAGSGVSISKLSKIAYEHSLTGLEFAYGIPGTLGGAVRMNAGAFGAEIKDIIVETKYIDLNGKESIISKEEHQFTYRNSIFSKQKCILLESQIKLKLGNKNEIKAKMDEIAQIRKEKQPISKPNAGSTFKRGNDFITAQLIDQCGLKGKKVGAAEVSTLHAGFIINNGGATAKDVLELIKIIKNSVYEKYQKRIELEVLVLGED